MPDLNAILAQRHSLQSIVASFVGAREKGMLFHDDEGFHVRMGIAQDSGHSGFVKRNTSGFSRWIKPEIKIFSSAFRVDVVPGGIVIWKFNGRTDQHGQNVRNKFHLPLVYYRLLRFGRRDLGFGGFCRDTLQRDHYIRSRLSGRSNRSFDDSALYRYLGAVYLGREQKRHKSK